MRSFNRNQRKFQKKRNEQLRKNNSLGDQETALNSAPPNELRHPYHNIAKVPPEARIVGGRSTSGTSRISDVSMDEFSGTPDSALEYSDTSGEDREDAYFLPDESTGGPKSLLSNGRGSSGFSGESTFREMKHNGSKSSRVVRFTYSGASAPVGSFSSSHTIDEYGNSTMGSKSQMSSNENLRSSPNPTLHAWMTNLAYSFRSPPVGVQKMATPSSLDYNSAKFVPSRPVYYHHHNQFPSLPYNHAQGSGSWERAPLVNHDAGASGAYGSEIRPVASSNAYKKDENGGDGGSNGSPGIIETRGRPNLLKRKSTAATVAACFLRDFEAGRPPTLSSNFDTITRMQLQIYQVHFSWAWRILGVGIGIIVLFVSHSKSPFTTALMHTYAIVIFFIEVWMREQLYGLQATSDPYHAERRLNRPLILFLLILGLESWVWYIFPPDPNAEVPALVSSIFKPVVFFYVSQKARHALEGLQRIFRTVVRVIMVEMFLILGFAAVGCQLFQQYESFKDLTSAWLSLFELSTTVVNPSLWMPMYQESRRNAVFFVFFIIVGFFYLHSLVLSVVFSTYIHAASDIHERSLSVREEAIRRAFLALRRDDVSEYISASSIRKTLQLVRPHYSTMKIKALMNLVDPLDQHAIDFPTFRTRIRQSLSASIRTTRSNSSLAMTIEWIAVLVAASNFVYVILVTSDFSPIWFNSTTVLVGCVITFFGLLELLVRFNPLRIPNFTPITRLNATFDGLALTGALVSCLGIVQYMIGFERATDYILMGRAIDMIRMMRFSQIFRDVVRRSADVLPAMAGPVLLVLTTIHVFVSLGIALWGGAIDPEIFSLNEELTPLYYLNNFNSYMEGLVTVFNVLVVNDWHAIAQVFLFSERCSSPYIVYPFFVLALCCSVFICLNVITAFFVESFVTKIEDNRLDFGDDRAHVKSERSSDFSIKTGENTNVKRISSSRRLTDIAEPEEQAPVLTAEENSEDSMVSGEDFAFDVFEREGFDQIMRTVAGTASVEEEEAFARSVCASLEMFENLVPGREKVGFMVCCQQSMNRFGITRFQNAAKDFIQGDVLHKVVSDMHAELLVLTSRKKFENRCLVRSFPHKTDPSLRLEISASLLRHQPAVSLLVSCVMPSEANDP